MLTTVLPPLGGASSPLQPPLLDIAAESCCLEIAFDGSNLQLSRAGVAAVLQNIRRVVAVLSPRKIAKSSCSEKLGVWND